MASIADALEKTAPAVARELASRLQGFLGGILRSYLPQTWVFQTESESASLTVDRQGKATVSRSALPAPDVTIEAKHAVMLAALLKGSNSKAHTTDFRVTTHTSKGKTAFQFLRQRFGF